MNLVLLFPEDFVGEKRVRLSGRRLEAIERIGADVLRVGIVNGRIGSARMIAPGELEVSLESEPPTPIPLTLILALPRPKVLNRVIAAATSMGIKRIFLINAWRVEKSYWKSPRLSADNIRAQCILGLEQARDTVMPQIELRRFFAPFVNDELPAVAQTRCRSSRIRWRARSVRAMLSGPSLSRSALKAASSSMRSRHSSAQAFGLCTWAREFCGSRRRWRRWSDDCSDQRSLKTYSC